MIVAATAGVVVFAGVLMSLVDQDADGGLTEGRHELPLGTQGSEAKMLVDGKIS